MVATQKDSAGRKRGAPDLLRGIVWVVLDAVSALWVVDGAMRRRQAADARADAVLAAVQRAYLRGLQARRPAATPGGAHGVTLVELVVVVGLIAVLAVASYAQQLASTGARTKASAEQLASLMRRVTVIAGSQNRPYRIVFTPGGSALSIQLWNGSSWTDASTVVAPSWLSSTPTIAGGAVVGSTSYPNNRFIASPLGALDVNGGTVGGVAVTTTAGTVVIQTASGGGTLQVMSTSTGRVTVSR